MRLRSRQGKRHGCTFQGKNIEIGPKPVTLTAEEGEYAKALFGSEIVVINRGSRVEESPKEHPHEVS